MTLDPLGVYLFLSSNSQKWKDFFGVIIQKKSGFTRIYVSLIPKETKDKNIIIEGNQSKK